MRKETIDFVNEKYGKWGRETVDYILGNAVLEITRIRLFDVEPSRVLGEYYREGILEAVGEDRSLIEDMIDGEKLGEKLLERQFTFITRITEESAYIYTFIENKKVRYI